MLSILQGDYVSITSYQLKNVKNYTLVKMPEPDFSPIKMTKYTEKMLEHVH